MNILFSKEKQAAYYYDYWLILAVFALLAIGFLLLASASMGISDKWFHNPLHFLARQTVYLIIGIVVVFFVKQIPLTFWEKISGYLLLASIFLLILVLVPGIGREVKGSTRWIGLSIASLQVSEFAKFSIIIYISSYLLRHQEEVRASIRGFVNPLVLLGIISWLLILEPDFGAIVVMLLTALGMMYLAGARLWQFIILLALVGIVLGALIVVSPYRLLRLTSFLNPWAKPYDSGYQLVQSLIAFGRGGIFGIGLGNSIQKLFYLPEAHTDFLFAVLAEEFGIFGQVIVIGLFSFFVARTFYLGRLAGKIKNWFASYLAYGLGLLIGIQVIINIGVNIGLLPTKGLTLPFMSYGGSSMLFNCVIVAVLLRIHHEVTFKAIFTPRSYFLTTKVKHKKAIEKNTYD
ncbi:MAG: putative lipid II flippase FtsW [Coxiellaceae bacterium]|jgi:cell division protein FtsW|nr:putative lipid II flippase FtsW [Coxiellaceae bacterium]